MRLHIITTTFTILLTAACADRRETVRVFGTRTQEGTAIEPIAVSAGSIQPLPPLDGPLAAALAAASAPARFAGQTPQFRVEWRTFIFQHVKGPQEKRLRLIFDRDRLVALLQSGDLQLAALTPDQARPQVALTTGRYHMDHFVGPKIDFGLFCIQNLNPQSGQPLTTEPTEGKGTISTSDIFESAPGQLILVRRQSTPGREVENRLVLSLDPVFGYRVDGTYRVRLETPPKDGVRMAGHVYTPGTYVPWEEDARYDWAVYSHDQDPVGRFRGWPMSLYGIDRANREYNRVLLSDPGFLAYLSRDPAGFSPCVIRRDGTGPHGVGQCNAGHGPGFSTTVKPTADGPMTVTCSRTLVNLPPEQRAWMLERTTFIEADRTGTFIRLGRTEDFEDQPISLRRPQRGLIWTSCEPPIVTGIAHSGKKALLIEGRVWPNLPQVILEPQTRYRLEAWFLVQPWTAEERAAIQAKATKAIKSDQPVPEIPTAAKAWIDGDLYEWSPHVGPMLVKQRTTEATPGGWQRVELEFTTPAWDPFINLVFHAEGGRAWMDDLRLAPVR